MQLSIQHLHACMPLTLHDQSPTQNTGDHDIPVVLFSTLSL